MKKRISKLWPLLFAVVLVFLGGCVSTQQAEQAAEDMLYEKIMKTVDVIMDGDFETYVNTFDKDGVLLIHQRSPYIGHEELTVFFEAMFSNGIANRVHKVEEVKVSGDMAFAWGYFSDDFTPKATGQTVRRNGKFLVVLKKDKDGNWKRHVLMPMPEPQ